jgi:hypothetical protein
LKMVVGGEEGDASVGCGRRQEDCSSRIIETEDD